MSLDNNQNRLRSLPEGNVFGDREDDEFTVNLDGEETGVFKRFEYYSMPFSMTGQEQLFDEVMQAAEENGTSFADELANNEAAEKLVDDFYDRMEDNPGLSKEMMDVLLADVYVDDNVIAEMDEREAIEEKLGKFTAGWKHLSDFYGIEGLVGGDAEEVNPFLNGEDASMVAGGLDSLETVLPALRENMGDEEWTRTALKLSSVVERDFEQVDHAVDVLDHIHGQGDYDEGFLEDSAEVIDDLANARFDTNAEFGKFYNTFIRFHNWMPLNIKEGGPEGDQYDSICAPAKDAMRRTEGSDLHEDLDEIGDATSPKGLALSLMLDEEVEVNADLGDSREFQDSVRKWEQKIDEELEEGRREYAEFTLDDPAMYTGLVGGKWKGLKLLDDAREALDLDYEVADGRVISSVGVEQMLEEAGVQDLVEEDVFEMEEDRRQEIVDRIDGIDVSELVDDLDEDVIVRSSMYGEDGASNFAGTYESFHADGNPEQAVREVVKSYFSEKAVNAREDKGMTHSGGISVILQDAIEHERGGVVHLTDESYSITEAEDAENAVEGEGEIYEEDTIQALVEGTSIEGMAEDLEQLHETFGDIDLEYAVDDGEVYITQMRPKHQVVDGETPNFDSMETVKLGSFEEMYEAELDGEAPYVVRMGFLGRDNIMDREREIEQFLRENQDKIGGVEGYMPAPAHIPNNIEGHFRIPYKEV
ncbi:MAG: PEP/pyruvate-binding domain-containing protein [Candidatus Nanohalobium sp.]